MTQYYVSLVLNWPKTVITTDDRNDVTNCSINQEYVTQSISNRIKVSLSASDDMHQNSKLFLYFLHMIHIIIYK